MAHYPLVRGEKLLAWLHTRRDGDYDDLYAFYSDRVDVLKVTTEDAVASIIRMGEGDGTAPDIISVVRPRYRVTPGGGCTCDGYHFRETCRHVKQVKSVRVRFSAR